MGKKKVTVRFALGALGVACLLLTGRALAEDELDRTLDRQAEDLQRRQQAEPEPAPEPTQPEEAMPQPEEDPEARRLRDRVEQTLERDEGLQGSDIEVTATEDGAVTLSGRVDSPEARDRAMTLAAGTEGVVDVQDDLAVEPDAAPDAGP